jgi:hypothetical protein
MNRIACSLTSMLVVTASAFAGFYWGAPLLLRYFEISENAQGAALLPFLLICIICTLIGLLVGLALYPLILRPMLSSIEFWTWIGGERTLKIPLMSLILERWAVFLYGPRTHKRG